VGAAALQGRQKQIELRRIFRREQAGEPAITGVVDGERGLHAAELATVGLKHGERAPKLISLRSIFGIKNDRVWSAGE